jgi:hypothetical protein
MNKSMNDKFRNAVNGVIDKVLEVARIDDTLRKHLKYVAEELMSLTAEVEWKPVTVSDERAILQGASATSLSIAGAVDEKVDELTQICTLPQIEEQREDDAPASDALLGNGFGHSIDIPTLINRLSFKAKAARWAAERKRLLAKHADYRIEIAPHDRDFITQAKAQNSYLWMLRSRDGQVTDSDGFEMIAACFETLAEAVAVAQFFLERDKTQSHEIERSLGLLAEAQSALRGVAEFAGYADDDQLLIYRTLREIADERGIFLSAGMKLNDPVDPSEWAALAGEVHALRQKFIEREQAERKKTKLLNKLNRKATELLSAVEPEADAWKGMIPVVEELVSMGVQPSRIELREALKPIAHQLPAQTEASKAFDLVLQAMERYRGTSTKALTVSKVDSPSEEVRKVAKLLAGKSIVIIGADGRPDAIKSIEKAFGLKSVEWIATTEHDSYRKFEPNIARSNVAVVLLLIRWASHSFGEVASLCSRHGKPLVRIPGGYNPNQIAAAILSQVSDRLGQKQSSK